MRAAPLLLCVCALAAQATSPSLDDALKSVRRGNLQYFSQVKVVSGDLPVLVRYSHDANAAVRRESVILMATLGQDACGHITDALVDADADNRERAARILFRLCPRLAVNVEGGNAKLRESIRLGNASSYAFALLSRSAIDIDQQFVAAHLNKASSMVKAESWSRPVPLNVAATLAASVMNLPNGNAALSALLGEQRNAEFLATSISTTENRATLATLAPLLLDRRAVTSGVPSHSKARRRVCDVAADQFVAALHLEREVAPRKVEVYSDADLTQLHVRALALNP